MIGLICLITTIVGKTGLLVKESLDNSWNRENNVDNDGCYMNYRGDMYDKETGEKVYKIYDPLTGHRVLKSCKNCKQIRDLDVEQLAKENEEKLRAGAFAVPYLWNSNSTGNPIQGKIFGTDIWGWGIVVRLIGHRYFYYDFINKIILRSTDGQRLMDIKEKARSKRKIKEYFESGYFEKNPNLNPQNMSKDDMDWFYPGVRKGYYEEQDERTLKNHAFFMEFIDSCNTKKGENIEDLIKIEDYSAIRKEWS